MAVELAFFKWFEARRHAVLEWPLLSARNLQLAGLTIGYAPAVKVADLLLGLLSLRRDVEMEAFVLRVVDCMLPAAKSLAGYTLGEETAFASTLQHALSGAVSRYDATLRLTPYKMDGCGDGADAPETSLAGCI